ncbi:MAG: hypothetical protein AB7U45_03750 [Desulfamplus sp.]
MNNRARIKPFEYNHIVEMIKNGVRNEKELLYGYATDPMFIDRYMRLGGDTMVTITYDDEPLIVSVLIKTSEEKGEVLNFFAENIKKKFNHKIYIAYLSVLNFYKTKAKKLVCTVEKGARTNDRFARHVGFKKEGCIRKGNAFGNDLNIYGLTTEG